MKYLALFGVLAALALAGPPRLEEADERSVMRALAGDFVLTSRYWREPGASAEVTTLEARRALALDGRVLRIDVGSADAGFQGTGLLGYDEAASRHWYVWADTSVSGAALLEGKLAEDGSGILEGHTPTPAGPQPLRVSIRRDGAAEIHTYGRPEPGGGHFTWLELRYVPR